MSTNTTLTVRSTGKDTNFVLARELVRNTDINKVKNLYGKINDDARFRQFLLETLGKLQDVGPGFFSSYGIDGSTWAIPPNANLEKDFMDGLHLIAELPEVMDSLGLVKV